MDTIMRLTRLSVGNLGEFYTPNVYLKTPRHEIRNAAEIASRLTHLFERVDMLRVEITATRLQHNRAMRVWNLRFQTRRWLADEQIIHSASPLRLAIDSRVTYQRNYWDATEDPCIKLPVVRRLLRWLRHRLFRRDASAEPILTGQFYSICPVRARLRHVRGRTFRDMLRPPVTAPMENVS